LSINEVDTNNRTDGSSGIFTAHVSETDPLTNQTIQPMRCLQFCSLIVLTLSASIAAFATPAVYSITETGDGQFILSSALQSIVNTVTTLDPDPTIYGAGAHGIEIALKSTDTFLFGPTFSTQPGLGITLPSAILGWSPEPGGEPGINLLSTTVGIGGTNLVIVSDITVGTSALEQNPELPAGGLAGSVIHLAFDPIAGGLTPFYFSDQASEIPDNAGPTIALMLVAFAGIYGATRLNLIKNA
jgi:hypothetical protein